MPNFTPERLEQLATDIFIAAGARPSEAHIVASSLVEANLLGHDSHGVIRIAEYLVAIEKGWVELAAEFQVVQDNDAFAVIDGGWGWGQVAGRKAMEIAISKAAAAGVGMVSGRRCYHLGRVGEFPTMAAEQGFVGLLFVNTHGGGKIVAPWGGRERRLSANPIAFAVPRSEGGPLVMDISTCAIAGGKVKVAFHRGVAVPANCIINAQGEPTTNPADFFGPPEGALLPFGGHKGFALGFMADIFAGALSGAGCSRPDVDRVGNSFLAIVIDIDKVRGKADYFADVDGLVEYVKSCELAAGFNEILVPGEPEARERRRREKEGIEVDAETWRQIVEGAGRYGVAVAEAI